MLVLKIALFVMTIFFSKVTAKRYDEDDEVDWLSGVFAILLFIAYIAVMLFTWNSFTIPFIFLLATIVCFIIYANDPKSTIPLIAIAVTILAFIIAWISQNQ